MARDDKDIAAALRKAMADEVGQERYDLWFGDGVQLRLSGRSIVVSARDQFTLDRVRSQFRSALAEVGERVAGHGVTVQFRRDESGDAPPSSPLPAGPRVKPRPTRQPDKSHDRKPARRFSHLDQFVVGEGNRVAYTAAQMVGERPGAVSPLFVFGSTGTGKTHLLEGIWSAARTGSRCRALYLSAEQFTSMFLEALQGKGLPSFRYKYRHVDLLLIDDIQFFLGKRATLVELQHTLDALLRQRCQLVLAADRSPAQLTGFGPELAARLSGGLVCAIEPPDVETRRGILQRLARNRSIPVPNDVLDMIAIQLNGDARQLTGALNQLDATSRAFDSPITVEMAQATLADVFRATCRVVQLRDIERAVCDVFGLEASTLQSARKARVVSQPRALAMWLARKYTRAAYAEIGQYFGRRSHSTVISAEKQVKRWVQQGQPIRMSYGQCGIDEAIRRVESQIRAG